LSVFYELLSFLHLISDELPQVCNLFEPTGTNFYALGTLLLSI